MIVLRLIRFKRAFKTYEEPIDFIEFSTRLMERLERLTRLAMGDRRVFAPYLWILLFLRSREKLVRF